jgi:serine/threonine-protein kinase RsbW/stage II sporulation protein AB (anti-sigma F factor)
VGAPESRSLALELPALPDSAAHARRAVSRMLDGLDVDAWPVGIIVSEAVTNAVLHAYRDRAPGRVRVEARLDERVLTVVVSDDGMGMSPNPDSPGLGVGLALIERLADEVEIQSHGGTRLQIRVRLVAAPAAP